MMNQLRHMFFPMKPTFSGWGMTTTSTEPPWKNPDPVAAGFMNAHHSLKTRIRTGVFKFNERPADTLEELMWRHYIIYSAFTLAATNTSTTEKNIAECGVCDGMGVSFAIQAAIHRGCPVSCYLYDAWAAMRADLLTYNELAGAGNYSNLDRLNTERNLSCFNIPVFFNQGYIPNVFDYERTVNPETIALLMIDLNSSGATKAALDRLYGNVTPGGVVLFDDYLWPPCDTKIAVNGFLCNKSGVMLAMPTGQGMFIKGGK